MPNSMEEVLIRLPKSLFLEIRDMAQYEQRDVNDLIYQATKHYVEHKREIRELHEVMQRGYEEMARINLNLCSEAFMAEEEAKITLDRLVIGV